MTPLKIVAFALSILSLILSIRTYVNIRKSEKEFKEIEKEIEQNERFQEAVNLYKFSCFHSPLERELERINQIKQEKGELPEDFDEAVKMVYGNYQLRSVGGAPFSFGERVDDESDCEDIDPYSGQDIKDDRAEVEAREEAQLLKTEISSVHNQADQGNQ